MLKPLVCGTFHHEDDDDLSFLSPRKSKKKHDNPYSSRGLDKFSELLADLDEKRQKIYSQMNPHDISFVRFVYSNTDDFVPIVVKVKNKDKDHNHNHNNNNKHKSEELRVVKARHLTPISESRDKSSGIERENLVTMTTNVKERKQQQQQQPKLEHEAKDSKKSFFSWNIKMLDLWRPCFYVPMVMILILVFLTLFGRSISILCTCVLWYIIPTLKGTSSSSSSSSSPRKSVKKKDYVRGLNEIKKVVVDEGTNHKKKDYGRGLSEIKKVVMTNEGNTNNKKKDYVRGFSEKNMVVNEGVKKKDYVRRWSEKKIDETAEGLVSLSSDHSPEASKNKSATPKQGHKKSW
ncbi:hypothetical protein RIF29_05918 [Crotalaria pallida]|uniref:ZCF37 n=1 Tax=Crotalaria pallida TaxID=3830 RepID=A0AAN9J2L5_CROPI